MKRFVTIVLGISILAGALLGFYGMHHDTVDINACAAICLQTARPIATAAVLVATVLFFSFLATVPGVFEFHAQTFSWRIGDSPGGAFRQKFSHWFSLLEHSPTA